MSPPPVGTAVTRRTQVTSAGEDLERREPSSTVGGDIKLCSHCAEQYGDSSEIKNKCQVIQQPPSWVLSKESRTNSRR